MRLVFSLNVVLTIVVFTKDGRTALMIAVDRVDVVLLQMLLKAGADVMIKDMVSKSCSLWCSMDALML